MITRAKNNLFSKAGLLILSALILRSFNPILFKFGALSLHSLSFYFIITNIYYQLSMINIFLMAIVWQLILRKFDLSVAYPFLSFVLVVILIASHFVFKEAINMYNVIGVIVICIGICVLGSAMINKKESRQC